MQVRKYLALVGGLSLPLFTASLLCGQNSRYAQGQSGQNSGYAQNSSTSGESTGPTASELITGNSTSVSGGLTFDSSVGWNFNKHLGADVGIPYLLLTRPGLFEDTAGYRGYVQSPFVGCAFFFGCYYGVATSPRMWAGELGDVYADVHYARTYKQYNFATVLTGDFPTASFRKGLTDGRVQWDWFNHLDTNFHGFNPFVNFGMANGRMNQHFIPRPFNTGLPFRTLGYMADFEGGVQYKIWRRFTLGASMWDVLPMGPQKMYSELVWEGAVSPSGTLIPATPTTTTLPAVIGYLSGDPSHGRAWNTRFETVGGPRLDRDNGYSATLAVSPYKNVDLQVGYNHSVRYGLDEVTFTVGVNANALVRKITNY